MNYVILQVLSLVDDRHVLEIGKEPVGFTVGLIEKLILEAEVL